MYAMWSTARSTDTSAFRGSKQGRSRLIENERPNERAEWATRVEPKAIVMVRQQDPWYKDRAPKTISETGRNNLKEPFPMIDHIRRNMLATGAACDPFFHIAAGSEMDDWR
jgi:hypothetical protein